MKNEKSKKKKNKNECERSYLFYFFEFKFISVVLCWIVRISSTRVGMFSLSHLSSEKKRRIHPKIEVQLWCRVTPPQKYKLWLKRKFEKKNEATQPENYVVVWICARVGLAVCCMQVLSTKIWKKKKRMSELIWLQYCCLGMRMCSWLSCGGKIFMFRGNIDCETFFFVISASFLVL